MTSLHPVKFSVRHQLENPYTPPTGEFRKNLNSTQTLLHGTHRLPPAPPIPVVSTTGPGTPHASHAVASILTPSIVAFHHWRMLWFESVRLPVASRGPVCRPACCSVL
jgi:hypothetical protein